MSSAKVARAIADRLTTRNVTFPPKTPVISSSELARAAIDPPGPLDQVAAMEAGVDVGVELVDKVAAVAVEAEAGEDLWFVGELPVAAFDLVAWRREEDEDVFGS